MGVNVVIAPTVEPIALDEAATVLRSDASEEQVLILGLIRAARLYCEKRHARAYVTQTLELTLDGFPVERYIELPRPPLRSVESIAYVDVEGVTHTLNAATYVVDDKSTVGKVVLMPRASWPLFEAMPVNAVRIRYVAGYGDATAVPETSRQAMFQLVHFWYNNPGTKQVSKSVEFAVDSLLALDTVYGR